MADPKPMFEIVDPDVMKADPIELAWAAGFFDGEGYIAFRLNNANKNGKYYRRIEIQIGQIDTFVLERFARAVDCGTVYGPVGLETRDGRSPLYKYNLTGIDNIKRVWHLLMPYLSPIKLEQWRKAMELYDSCPVCVTADKYQYYKTFPTHAAAEAARKKG